MKTFYIYPHTKRKPIYDKPDIVEVVSRYTSLRKQGKEYVGLAPCHDDRHPSLRVNPDKQAWYCDPCGRGGDVIDYVMRAEGVSFREALSILGIDNAEPPRKTRERKAAEKVVSWLNELRSIIRERLSELQLDIEYADELGDKELAESFWRQRLILSDLYEDLGRAEYVPDFLKAKESIERIALD